METANAAMWEWPLTLATFTLLVGYHIWLIQRVRHQPLETAVGITNHVRSQWVCCVMGAKDHLLAIQTLRNNLMAANFLASTAILISLGLLSITLTPAAFNQVSHALNLGGSRSEAFWMFKLLVLVVLFFFAFFNFTLSIRYYNHVGFMIGMLQSHDPQVTPETVAGALNQGALHYTLGMRGFYLAVPIGLWIFGPIWMLTGSIAMLSVLYHLDRRA